MVALIKDHKRTPGTRQALLRNTQPSPGWIEVWSRWQAGPATEETTKATGLAEEPLAGPRSRARSSPNGDTAITLYLREVGQVKPLTPHEEVELAARVKRGDKKARDRMIKASLRQVVAIAREFEDIGLPLLDLISEGNIGLLKAVERFDPAKDSKLSTYSAWWIKQSIKRALAAQSKAIRRTG
jgi:DNA-directed RNA polymerase sigma subunit (sigma70/sigma32)